MNSLKSIVHQYINPAANIQEASERERANGIGRRADSFGEETSSLPRRMTPDITDREVSREEDYKNGETTGKEYRSPTSSSKLEHDQNRQEDSFEKKEGLFRFKTDLIWTNIIAITLVHLASLYYLLTFDYLRDVRTLVWMYAMYWLTGFGVTGGVHRYFTHRAFKAARPLQVLMIILYAAAGQNRIFDWVRDHRVHHKFTDTDADPHNSNRGFFFSHVGWLMLRKHPQVLEKGREIDMSDIKNDRLIMLADKYFNILKIVFCFLLPTMLPVYGWGETWGRAFISQGILRYVIVLNCTWSVNSAAHLWGMKPYDKSINPSESRLVSYLTGGEGWHNYHHVFPWDYKASELAGDIRNTTTTALHILNKLGWIYELKEPSWELINAVAKRRGDGSHPIWKEVALDEADTNK